MSSQQGGVVLGMTIMLVMLATLMLHAMQRQLDLSLSLVADEQQYVRDFQQAQSALNWGLQQAWPQVPGWTCRTQAEYQWRACLLQDDEALLFGEPVTQQALLPADDAPALRLWHWVRANGNRLKALPGGWIDYCPLSPAQACDDAQ